MAWKPCSASQRLRRSLWLISALLVILNSVGSSNKILGGPSRYRRADRASQGGKLANDHHVVFIIPFESMKKMAAGLARISAFIEDPQFIGQIVPEDRLLSLPASRYAGHNFSIIAYKKVIKALGKLTPDEERVWKTILSAEREHGGPQSDYYVIAHVSSDDQTLEHEKRHATYYFDKVYRKRVQGIWAKTKRCSPSWTEQFQKHLSEKYARGFWVDEFQAIVLGREYECASNTVSLLESAQPKQQPFTAIRLRGGVSKGIDVGDLEPDTDNSVFINNTDTKWDNLVISDDSDELNQAHGIVSQLFDEIDPRTTARIRKLRADLRERVLCGPRKDCTESAIQAITRLLRQACRELMDAANREEKQYEKEMYSLSSGKYTVRDAGTLAADMMYLTEQFLLCDCSEASQYLMDSALDSLTYLAGQSVNVDLNIPSLRVINLITRMHSPPKLELAARKSFMELMMNYASLTPPPYSSERRAELAGLAVSRVANTWPFAELILAKGGIVAMSMRFANESLSVKSRVVGRGCGKREYICVFYMYYVYLHTQNIL
ncbi:hypothetical protein AAMO2058_000940900 [Amorphochlora amoebiformis]